MYVEGEPRPFPTVAEMMAPFEDEVAPYRFEESAGDRQGHASSPAAQLEDDRPNYSDHLHIPIGHLGIKRLFGRNYRISATRTSTAWR